MNKPSNYESTEVSSPDLLVRALRSLVRAAPVLAAVLALSACKPDKELQDCKIEVARLQGVLDGMGVEHDKGTSEDLKTCLREEGRAEGVLSVWKSASKVNNPGHVAPPVDDVPLPTTVEPSLPSGGPEPVEPAALSADPNVHIKAVKPPANNTSGRKLTPDDDNEVDQL